MKKLVRVILALVVLAILGVGFLWVVDNKDVTASKPAPETNSEGQDAHAAKVERGRYLAVAGDCVACHTREGGEEFAGGLPMETPFGTIYTPNITPDKETGLGGWTETDFYRALHLGKDEKKANLYPAFSYPYYTKVSRSDAEAIGAYLMSLTPVKYEAPKNKLGFPFNIRFMLKGWNLLNFRPGHFKSDATKSAQWNRGSYLVNGLGHCGACHTPKNILFGDKNSQALQGGVVENWNAPDLTSDPKTGLGNWSQEDIVTFLKTGGNAHSNAYGTMTDVVRHSTSHMTDGDLNAIAIYLKSLAAPKPRPASPKPDAAVMAAGKAVYDKSCQDCHSEDGTGVPGLYPPVAGNVNMNAADPSSVIHILLTGTKNSLMGEGMPGYANLSDKDLAALATYIRNMGDNNAPAVSEGAVAKMRKAVVKPEAAAAK